MYQEELKSTSVSFVTVSPWEYCYGLSPKKAEQGYVLGEPVDVPNILRNQCFRKSLFCEQLIKIN